MQSHDSERYKTGKGHHPITFCVTCQPPLLQYMKWSESGLAWMKPISFFFVIISPFLYLCISGLGTLTCKSG